MAWLPTPGNFSLRAELYHQLGFMISAGLPLINALEKIHENPPSNAFQPSLKIVLIELEAGRSLSESLARVKGWISPFDIALISAAELSGRLDSAFKTLSAYYKDRAD